MSKAVLGMIEELGGQVEAAAGRDAREQILAGSEAITAKTGGAEIAQWAKGAVDRLDALLPAEIGVQIMENCGANCARRNSALVDRAVARRRKHADEESFLAAEIKKPMAGTRLEREGDHLVQVYTPQAFSRPMRCYCALVKDLPAGESMSQTYCHCSKAFVRALWEAALGRPVRVELLESAVSGASECRFRVAPLEH
jgi:predicted hydrocarbon binding protein